MTRILILDNQSATCELSKTILALGYEVSVSNMGVEGIKAARVNHPHVIVINTPILGEFDWQMCKQIREFSQAPILILSADGDPQKVIDALANGADDVLSKPVSNRVLVAHLEKLSRRAQAELKAATEGSTFHPLIY